MSGDLPIDKQLAMALCAQHEEMAKPPLNPQAATEARVRPTAEQYESAVLHVYDKAETSEDWFVLRTLKECAGSAWLDVCFTASERLDLGEALVAAFYHAAQQWRVRAPGSGPQKIEVVK